MTATGSPQIGERLSPSSGAPGRASSPVPAPRRSARVLAGSLLLAALAGCNHGSGVQLSPLSSTLPNASSSPSPTEEAAVLGQYRTFWSSLTAVSRMPAGAREAALARYTVDPELRSLLAGMLATDRRGEVYYGADVPRASQASIAADGLTAVVNDCQDSTHSGVATRAGGQPLTAGVARNHVVVTMKKAAGLWKVAFVAYTKTPC